jgi:hypothetical protein
MCGRNRRRLTETRQIQARKPCENSTTSGASGASNRTTLTDGTAMFDEGTDDSPVELDGLGGNAGISTPYLPFGGNPPQQYPEYQQMNDESVMRINGQDVRATLDGVGIPFAFLLHLLQNGSALPAALDRYQHLQGFSFDNRGGGTFRSTWSTTSTSPGWVEKSDNNGKVTGRSWEPDGTVHTNTFEVNWSFGAALIGAFVPPPPQDEPLTNCTFNINLKITDAKLTSDQIDKIKKGMKEYFSNAGQTLVFDDPNAAKGTKDGSYDLTISDHFAPNEKLEKDNLKEEAKYKDNPTFRFGAELTLGYTNVSFFGGPKNNGFAATYWIKYSMFGRITQNDENYIKLIADIAVHESGHYFLKNILPRTNGGHPKDYGNVMSNINLKSAKEWELWGFSRTQAKELSTKCETKKK